MIHFIKTAVIVSGPLKNTIIKNISLQLANRVLIHAKEMSSSPSSMGKLSPVKMKIENPKFDAVFTPELTALAALFKKYGYELRIAGGAVRDLLIDIQPHDLDFATTATPDQMKEMFTKEEIRMINTKGENHGTITPRINDKENFEVTTLRIDLRSTDGRHAEVEFTKDWQMDANRRDLTINSMFLDLDGTVYDYFGGREDLLARRVVFVGDAGTRICEDYLRILRYFRFYGRIAQHPDRHEAATLNSIREHAEGLSRVSGERIWSELSKILAGNFAGELVTKIVELGIGKYIGLPEEPDMDEFTKVWQRANGLGLRPVTLLCGMLRTEDEVLHFHARCKLSAFERDLALFLIQNRVDQIAANRLRPYQQMVMKFCGKGKLSDVKQWTLEVLKYRAETKLLEEFAAWELPLFPVNGNMLKENGVPAGRLMGPILQKLRLHWADNDFRLSKEELMDYLPHILAKEGIKWTRKD